MKISNPFVTAQNVRCRCLTPKGEVCCMTTNRLEIEIPDETTEALVQAVTGGRSDAQAYASRMWTPDRGFMDVESFIGMRQVEADTVRLEMKQEKEQQRQEKLAKAKMVRETKEKAEKEAKEKANRESKEEVKIPKEEAKGDFTLRRENASDESVNK